MHQLTVIALVLAAVAGAGVVLALGWRPTYALSVVGGVAVVGAVLGLLVRLRSFSGVTVPAAALIAAPTLGVATQLVVIACLPHARVARLDAILLISSAVFAGMVLVSAESALEYLIVGVAGLILSGLFASDPGQPHRFLLLWLSCAAPQAASTIILPRMLRRQPGGLLAAGLLPVLWAVVGEQAWSQAAFRPWPVPALFTDVHPFGLPLTCDTRSERASLGFPLGFAPSHYWPRTPEVGTGPGH